MNRRTQANLSGFLYKKYQRNLVQFRMCALRSFYLTFDSPRDVTIHAFALHPAYAICCIFSRQWKIKLEYLEIIYFVKGL